MHAAALADCENPEEAIRMFKKFLVPAKNKSRLKDRLRVLTMKNSGGMKER